jgi:uncharacterized protein
LGGRNLLDVPFALVSPAGLEIARNLRWAGTWTERARGLLGQSQLGPGEGLALLCAPQIHTLGMRYSIDVVFCDRDWRVLHVIKAMPPNRMSRWVRGASVTVETRAGTLDATVVPGSRLRILPLSELSRADRRRPS